jgi:hypothetical protein
MLPSTPTEPESTLTVSQLVYMGMEVQETLICINQFYW